MKKQMLTLKYSMAKYKALEQYLDKQNKKIEGELQEYLEQPYKDQVPNEVKDFVQTMNPDEFSSEEKHESKQINRQNKQQKTEQTSSDAPTNTQTGPVLSM